MLDGPCACGAWHTRGEKMIKSEKGSMTVAEAGSRGGKKIAAERGHEHFVKIGRMGGQRVRELVDAGKLPSGHYQKIGEKGGNTTTERMDRGYFKRIGKVGGDTTRALVEAGKAAMRKNADGVDKMLDGIRDAETIASGIHKRNLDAEFQKFKTKVAPKPVATLKIDNCLDCPHSKKIRDPGSSDSFDSHDESLCCTKTPTITRTITDLGESIPGRFIIACARTIRREEAEVPVWCPLTPSSTTKEKR